MAGSEKSKQLSFDLAKLFTRYKKTVFRHVAIRICLCAIRRHTALHFTGTLFFFGFSVIIHLNPRPSSGKRISKKRRCVPRSNTNNLMHTTLGYTEV